MPQANSTAKKKFSLISNGSIDIQFAIYALVLLAIGLVMMYSASYTYSFYDTGSSSTMIKKQAGFAVLGLIAMAVVSKVNYRILKLPRIILIITIATLGLLGYVLVTPEVVPGFKRWINLGFTTFQPSEIAKFSIIIICAWAMERHHSAIVGSSPLKTPFARTLQQRPFGIFITSSAGLTLVYGFCIVLVAGLIYAEHHMSGAILILGIGAIMMYLGGFNKWLFVIGIAGVALVVIYLLMKRQEIIDAYENGGAANPLMKAYMGERIVAWLDKDYQPLGARWQTNNSIYAIGSGGFFGVGLGNSKQKHMYVSEPQNDFIFSIVCEELGFIGATIILVLFGLLIWRGVVIGLKAKDRFGAFLAMGIVFQIGLQVVLNVAVVTDFIPNTGISLPFFSYGGTSLDMLLVEMGVVLAISRQSNVRKLPEKRATVKSR